MTADVPPNAPEQLLDAPHLADALESDRFRQFLDHMPFAVAVSELGPAETITYANAEFERLTGLTAANIEGKTWDLLPGIAAEADPPRKLSEAVVTDEDYLGAFTIDADEQIIPVDAWSSVIQDDNGTPTYRLVALAKFSRDESATAQLAQRVLEKDTLLRELQHRVKNNLQMITALIRLEAQNVRADSTGVVFERLAGRVNALALLYGDLSGEHLSESIDLGVYLSQVASAVMAAHAVEGIRLDLKVDTWPVSINVAMPTGLVVNELLTNALKHAFVGREGGTITLHSLVDHEGCRVIVADDGNGLAEGVIWPQPGKLGMLIVKSLKQNAKAHVEVNSTPGKGVRVIITFACQNAAPGPDDLMPHIMEK